MGNKATLLRICIRDWEVYCYSNTNVNPNKPRFGTLGEIEAKLRQDKIDKGHGKRIEKLYKDINVPLIVEAFGVTQVEGVANVKMFDVSIWLSLMSTYWFYVFKVWFSSTLLISNWILLWYISLMFWRFGSCSLQVYVVMMFSCRICSAPHF